MDRIALCRLKRRTTVLFLVSLVVIGMIPFLSAGTFSFWQAWVLAASLSLPPACIAVYFFRQSPEFLERRMRLYEKDPRQKIIMAAAYGIFFSGLILAGADHRFGWTHVPMLISLGADICILIGFSVIFLAFRENVYAADTVETFDGQTVVDTGPYAVVRHPMYAGLLPIYLCIPLALGSVSSFAVFSGAGVTMVLRILDEERILRRDLPGYAEYCEKTNDRLIPFVW